jgi:hypothetical protein
VRAEVSAAATDALDDIVAAKLGLEERTPRPPICGMRMTIVPPALATSWSTFAGSEPEAKATVYIFAAGAPTPRVVAEPADVTSNAVATTARAAAAFPTRFL